MEKDLRSVLRREFNKFEVEEFQEASGGHAHNTFLVSFRDREPVFVKLDDLEELDWDQRFRVAAPAMEAVRERTDVPVPKVLCSKRLENGRLYLVTEVIEGSCPANWSDGTKFERMPVGAKTKMLRQLAGHLRDYHSIKFDVCGELKSGDGTEVAEQMKWKELFRKMLGEWTVRMEEDGYEHRAEKIEEAADGNADLLELEEKPSFLHCEAGLRNLIVGSRGDINAVVDWEWVVSGDPFFDLVRTDGRTLEVSFSTGESWERYRNVLYGAYFKQDGRPRNWRRKRDLYMLHHYAWQLSLLEDVPNSTIRRLDDTLKRLL